MLSVQRLLLTAAVQRILEGRQISGVFMARTGAALRITQSGLSLRPDYVGPNPFDPNWKNDFIYLNRGAFQQVPLGPGRHPKRPDNLGVGGVRGPAFTGVDFALAKNYSFTERLKLQIRADAFNG